ncbi:MAG: extracellular matrix/biofilm biosynthesis regulator RemA family protein [Anaerolineae bacterium]
MQQRGWPAGQPVSVGFGGAVAGDRIVALANPKSAPIQRAVRRAKEEGRLIDLTFGRRIRAVVFMDSGHVIRVAVSPETLLVRWSEVRSPKS